HVLARHLPAAHRALEVMPVARAAELKGSEVCRRARLLANHPDRDRAPARGIHRHDRAVVRVLEPNDFRLLALYPYGVDDRLDGLPPAVVAVAARRGNRFARRDLLDIHILLVHANNRQPERDAIVMADRHARARGLPGADDVPARTYEVRDIADGRMRDRAMWIVRENRLAASRLLSAHDPVVRSVQTLKR